LREAIEAAIADIDHEAFRTACNGLEDALASLYPEEETKTFTFDAIIHIYDGIRTAVQNKRLTVEAKSAEEAEHKLSKKIHDDFKMRTHLGLSSLLLTRVEEEEAK
ncbi:hypothetical protein, partial [Paenibacillus rhizolycopersici]|uniref:hypothetical protein n=1 Tax=Paenibacillus rhizolycopersici TaxID=2780073 RepID=UPI003D2C69FB